jgi:hypothetical protein
VVWDLLEKLHQTLSLWLTIFKALWDSVLHICSLWEK